jgi:hypothetical protein
MKGAPECQDRAVVSHAADVVQQVLVPFRGPQRQLGAVRNIHALSVPKVIRAKRASGCPKHLDQLPELEALLALARAGRRGGRRRP